MTLKKSNESIQINALAYFPPYDGIYYINRNVYALHRYKWVP